VFPDLSPHPDAPLEWWFCHGSLGGDAVERIDFMLSLFRHNSASDGDDGHMLIISVLNDGDDRSSWRSEVSPRLIESFIADTPQDYGTLPGTRHLVQALVDEIAANGIPTPFKDAGKPTRCDVERLSIRWNDFALREDGNEIAIGFDLPGAQQHCSLRLTPHSPWLLEPGDGAFRFGSMAYESCPRLTLHGDIDGAAITGEAWFDHQWGELSWTHGEGDEPQTLSWDWLGARFDDSSALIAWQRKARQTGEIVHSKAILFEPGKAPVTFDDAVMTPERQWRSTASMIDYPVEMRVEVPALGLDVVFAPTIDAQEIPVFGVMAAIWEGTGRVAGTRVGTSVSGTGRLELQGYGNLLDVRETQKRWVERIDATLRAFLPEKLSEQSLTEIAGAPRWAYDPHAQTAMLSEPVWDLLNRGGKHWRPIFGFLLLDALGTDPTPYETLVSVIPELIHNGSVIIDDIEDGSDTRRGDATLHRRYGVPTAINAGNMLYFLPLLSLEEHPHLSVDQREEIYRVLVRTFVRAHIGQGQDLYWSHPEHSKDRDFWLAPELGPQILQAHAFKTAAPLSAISEIACIIARAPADTRAACARFAENLGVAFQIVDDVNNFTTRPEWGKVRGEDIAAGKASYAIFKAISLLPPAERDRLVKLLSDTSERTSPDGLAAGLDLMERSGAFDACRNEAKALVEETWPAFSAAVNQTQGKVVLRLLITNLLNLPLEM